jgi:hypothetical protein
MGRPYSQDLRERVVAAAATTSRRHSSERGTKLRDQRVSNKAPACDLPIRPLRPLLILQQEQDSSALVGVGRR